MLHLSDEPIRFLVGEGKVVKSNLSLATNRQSHDRKNVDPSNVIKTAKKSILKLVKLQRFMTKGCKVRKI